ncbi:hypothetical protein V493_08611 [Pseudogymnoascus sp. VKM F-4281 (FW-2241)]|nr:hypothetical protein V493_08611 [Pseudogymnoascus sp. VKM F-4281 (FW-2241)]
MNVTESICVVISYDREAGTKCDYPVPENLIWEHKPPRGKRSNYCGADGIYYYMMDTGAESSTLACTSTHPGSDGKSRTGRRARALTEARREQNRRNQRRYRQKQLVKRREESQMRYTSSSKQMQELRPRPTNHGKEVPAKEVTLPIPFVDTPLQDDEGIIVLSNHVGIPGVELAQPLDFISPMEDGLQPIIDFENATELLYDPPLDTAMEASCDNNYMYLNELDTTIDHGPGLDRLLYGTSLSQNVVSASRLPSPRLNCLQFYQTTFVMATICNARSMGFVIEEEHANMSHCLGSSPFYQPVTPADDPKKLLAAITRPSTPTHLRPTLAQVLYPHPAFMDLIPIPAFRARAITLAATRPQAFGIWDLKKDMVVKEGLVPWSSNGGSSRSARMRGGQGQPWDMRSWEAAPWFLRKWRMLVDGEEGELWNQSLWWQKARGEIELQILDDADLQLL